MGTRKDDLGMARRLVVNASIMHGFHLAVVRPQLKAKATGFTVERRQDNAPTKPKL